MSEEKVITPFEIGVLAALTLVGKAVAMNPGLDVDQLKIDAKSVMDLLPREPKWAGDSPSIHQSAIESLLAGIEKVSS